MSVELNNKPKHLEHSLLDGINSNILFHIIRIKISKNPITKIRKRWQHKYFIPNRKFIVDNCAFALSIRPHISPPITLQSSTSLPIICQFQTIFDLFRSTSKGPPMPLHRNVCCSDTPVPLATSIRTSESELVQRPTLLNTNSFTWSRGEIVVVFLSLLLLLSVAGLALELTRLFFQTFPGHFHSALEDG